MPSGSAALYAAIETIHYLIVRKPVGHAWKILISGLLSGTQALFDAGYIAYVLRWQLQTGYSPRIKRDYPKDDIGLIQPQNCLKIRKKNEHLKAFSIVYKIFNYSRAQSPQ